MKQNSIKPMNVLQKYDHYDFNAENNVSLKWDQIMSDQETKTKQFIKKLKNFTQLEWLCINFGTKKTEMSQKNYFEFDQLDQRIQSLNLVVENIQDVNSEEGLEAEKLFKIFSLIDSCEQIVLLSINLYCCLITDEGIRALAQSVKFPNIKGIELKLQGNRIQDKGVFYIQQLMSNHKEIIYLNLRLGFNHLGIAGRQQLIELLLQQNQLQKLVLILSHCDIQNEGAQLILQQLKDMKQLRHLILNLERNNLRCTENNEIISIFGQLNQLYSIDINIQMNQIATREVQIKQQLNKLKYLVNKNQFW